MRQHPLTIGHGNGHNRRSLVTAVRTHGPFDSFGANEAHLLIEPFNRLARYRVQAVAPADAQDRRARETPILVDKRLEDLGSVALRVSEGVPSREKFAPDRWATCALYGHPVCPTVGAWGVAHLNVHPSWAMLLHGDPAKVTDTEPVSTYRTALVATIGLARFLREQGWLPVLTGDLQMRDGDRQPWSPHKLLIGAGFDIHSTRIDWLAYDHRLVLDDWTEFQLFDHTGFAAVLNRRSNTA